MTSTKVIGQQPPESAEIWFLWSVTACITAQILLRIFGTTSLSHDEAEMLVVSQTWAFGYGASQPPLYGWLMLVAFKLFGASVPVLAAIKNLLLWATFTLMYLASRDVLGSALKAALVSAALVSVPQIGWKAQFDLTHSVLALMMAALTFFVFLRLLRGGRWLDYILLGVCFALGMLSKYNYAIFVVALLVGAALIPSLRPRVVSLRMLVALGLGFLLFLPHLEWMWEHPTAALSRVTKLGIAENPDVFSSAGAGLLALGRALVSCALAPAALLVVCAFVPLPRSWSAIPAPTKTGWPEAKQLVLNTLTVSAIFVILLVIFSRSTALRDHWFIPLLLLFPMGLFILFERYFTTLRMKLLAFFCGGLALASLVGLAVTHLLPDLTGRPTRSSAPYGVMTQSIRNLGFVEGYILADTPYVAGNLKLRFPGSTVGEVEYGFSPPSRLERPLVIVWPGADSTMPAKLKSLWVASCDGTETEGSVTRITAPYEHSRTPYVLNVLIQPGCRPKSS